MTNMIQFKNILTQTVLLSVGFSLSVVFNYYLYIKSINLSLELNKNNKTVNNIIDELKEMKKKINILIINDRNISEKIKLVESKISLQNNDSDDEYFFADI